jgi:hypothetical protein
MYVCENYKELSSYSRKGSNVEHFANKDLYCTNPKPTNRTPALASTKPSLAAGHRDQHFDHLPHMNLISLSKQGLWTARLADHCLPRGWMKIVDVVEKSH